MKPPFPTQQEIVEATQRYRAEINLRMDTKHPSASPSIESMTITLHELFEKMQKRGAFSSEIGTPLLPGLRAAMRAIERHRDDYAHENGSVDYSTNAFEARREVMERLEMLDDAIEIINKLVKKEAT